MDADAEKVSIAAMTLIGPVKAFNSISLHFVIFIGLVGTGLA